MRRQGEEKKLLSKHDSASARHHELLASNRRVFKAREKQKDKATDTLAMLRKIYDDGRTVPVEANVAEWGDR